MRVFRTTSVRWGEVFREEPVIKANAQAQRRLLDLQGVDTAIAQLAHRAKTLPEHAVLAEMVARRSVLASRLVAADTKVSDLEREQARAESDLQPVTERLARNERRIADGSVGDPKALSSLVEEVAHLKRRIGVLEEAELEVMEALEAAGKERDELRKEIAALEDDVAAVTAKRDQQMQELQTELRAQQAHRASVVPELPADLLALYTKIAAGHGGVGAAELHQRRCLGCRLEINAADLRQFAAAAPDEVLRCEECGRILVRTERSGL
jgi:uncharacterized protein